MKNPYFILPVAVLLLFGCSSTAQHPQHDPTPIPPRVAMTTVPWWRAFHDPVIDQLVVHLEKQNIDISIAQARLSEARALKSAARAGFFPDITGKISGSRGNTNTPDTESFGQAGFDTSWELDIFGRVRAGVNAAEARRLGAEASIDDARNMVLADLVRAVVEWRQAKYTTTETRALLRAQDDQVSLLDSRVKAGLIDASFLERAKAQRAQTATTLPDAKAAANAAQYQMERLLAVRDGTVQTILTRADTKTLFIPAVHAATDISVERLRERPDIRMARANLLAAQANLKQAEANLWPRLNLLAFFGVQDGTNGVFATSNPAWSVAPGLTMPLLNFGRLHSQVDAADARTNEAALRYEDTVNRALQETRTALSDYLNGLNAVEAQNRALISRQDTVRIAKERFDRGLTDMTDLTTAQTELDQATLSLIRIKTSAAIAYVRLQKALALAIENP
jgi:multidrug efflux system outer membrane protein